MRNIISLSDLYARAFWAPPGAGGGWDPRHDKGRRPSGQTVRDLTPYARTVKDEKPALPPPAHKSLPAPDIAKK